MKTFALAAALLASTAAFAQTTTQSDTTTGTTMSDTMTPPSGTTNDGMRPSPSTSGMDRQTTTTGQTDSTMTTQPSTGQPMQGQQQMQGQQPMTDSTGSAGNMTAPPAGQASYPRCSATIIDQCRQSSARESDTRGGPPARRNRSR